jgi:hypothetical protein
MQRQVAESMVRGLGFWLGGVFNVTELLIVDTAPPPLTRDHAFGGLPVAPNASTFTWPHCKTCGGPMQFLGQLRIPKTEKLVLLFMCQNDPGLCDEWEPDAGGNCAMVVPTDAHAEVGPPEGGVTVRETRYGARQVTSQLDNYDAAREAWCKESGSKGRDVLGQILGTPSWIQTDETPKCDDCGRHMRFLAQLEQGPDWKTEMSFGGGGCAYVFDCACAQHSAKFLWQC